MGLCLVGRRLIHSKGTDSRIEQFLVSDLAFEFRPPNARTETRDQKPTA
jgi:hypothetical protein